MFVRRQRISISEEELYAYLDGGGTDRVAFLSAKTPARTIGETLAAMANANGGMVLLGVSQKGTLQSNLDVEGLCDSVADAGLLTDPPLFLPGPQVVESARGAVVVIQIPPGLPHIYSLQGLYLTRSAGKNRPLNTTELRRLLMERGDTGFEAQSVPGATLADLDEERIIRYLDQVSFAASEDIHQSLLARGCVTFAEQPGPLPRVLQEAQTGERLNPNENRLQRLVPTVAGLLLFGKNPQQYLRSAEIICVRYADTEMTDEFVRQDIGGGLADQVRQAEAFVVSSMRRGMKISGFAREETTEYPLPVVREAIVNAVAHRDYSVRGEGIRLLMFNDRMEIYSPGRLPGHITLENIKDERYSRNEAVVAVLSDMGYIERLGYGIDRMMATMKEQGLPNPVFEETAAGFRVVLQSASVELARSAPDEQPGRHHYLNERQEQAMAYIQEHGRITNSDYQALVPDVSAETIRRDLADLVEKNLLLRIGEKRATYYILK